ncbi:MAG: winged helix-turn-helix domain-containing protein [Acetobacteraceae bacterium]
MPGVRHPDRLGLHVRVVLRDSHGRSVAFGPGKADLLAAIADAGSIAAAGRRLGMSYKRAWSLVEALNAMFRGPLVDAAKGGAHGGGAMLTPLGANILAAYRALEAASTRSGRAPLGIIRQALRPEQ